MVIATIPTTIIEVATELNMIDSTSQWLYLISNPKKTNVTALIPFIKEGGNVAIASNNTIIDDKCTRDEKCLYHEILKFFATSLSKLVREEEAIYGQISDEEWEAIRLSKRERRDSMLEFIKVNRSQRTHYGVKVFYGKFSIHLPPLETIERGTVVFTVC